MRLVVYAGILIAAVALQSTLLTEVAILGVTPQLLFVVVMCLAYVEGAKAGVVLGFTGGLFLDLLLPESIVGLTALVYTMVGYAAGSVRTWLPSQSVWRPVVTIGITSVIAETTYALFAITMGQRWVSASATVKIIALVVAYNVLLTPLVLPLMTKLADRVRPERVVRF
jgi:rod shape-determining protein MreD